MTNSPLNSLVARLESAEILDGPAQTVARTVAGVLANGAAKDALSGAWLGHAAHPLLTDLPIGTWASSVLGEGERAGCRDAGNGVRRVRMTRSWGWRQRCRREAMCRSGARTLLAT
jgi:hypothetical protein